MSTASSPSTTQRTESLDLGGQSVPVRVETAPGRGRRPDLWPSVGEYPCYDPLLYQLMNLDEIRNRAYRAAIRALAPGRSVLDIGTGADLNWAREALAAGARAVVAIEALDDAFAAAKTRAADLPHADRLTLVHGQSTAVDLPDKAEICVSEVLGSIAGAEGAAAVLRDARGRLTVPTVRFIPDRCVTHAGAVALADVVAGSPAFSADSLSYLSRIFTSVGRPFDVRLAVANVEPDALVSDHAVVEELDFNDALEVDATRAATLTMHRAGRVDGLLLWLRLWCQPGGEPVDALHMHTSWIPAYVPLFWPAQQVQPGDRLDVSVRHHLSDDGVHPDYDVTAKLHTRTGDQHARHIAAHHPTQFRASPLYRRLFPVPRHEQPRPAARD